MSELEVVGGAEATGAASAANGVASGPETLEDLVADALTKDGLDDAKEVLASLPRPDRFVVYGPSGEQVWRNSVGEEYAGLAGSRVFAIFEHPEEGRLPGDVRVYVDVRGGTRDLSNATRGDDLFYCYRINRANLNTIRYSMTRDAFVTMVVDEWETLIGDGSDESEEEGEVPDGCDAELPNETICESGVEWRCACEVCVRGAADGEPPYQACADHRPLVDQAHLRDQGRPPVWVKMKVG